MNKKEIIAMALRHRAPQNGIGGFSDIAPASVTGIPSQITAPSDPGRTSLDPKADTGIIVASNSLLVPTTVIQATTILQTPTPTATVTPSSTPAPAASGLSTGAIAGIAIAIAAVLLIPAAYLVWRAHQIKKDGEWRASQRSSQEAMIMKESVEPKRDNGPPPPRPRRTPSDTPRPRPANSLGLFNFDLGSPNPAPSSPPQSPERPKPAPRLSIARTLQMRRSEVSVVNQERRSQQRIADLRNGLRNNPPTNRNSRDQTGASPPPPDTGAPSSPDSKFAPLNSIGTAVSAGRPKFSRNPSTSTIPRQPSPPPQQEMPHPTTATDPRQPPPGTQDMRQGPALLAPFLDRSQTRTANPPVSAYSVSDYHNSLQPQPRTEASLQAPTQAHSIGRAVSPIPRAVSPINNYQLPTLGLGTDDRFSWGGVGGVNAGGSHSNAPPHSHGPAHRVEDPDTEADRRSDVSGLSYDPVYDNRKSNGRAISPVESEESLGMRTREYL